MGRMLGERERERERETVRKKEGEQRPWEKKLSLVNQITLVTGVSWPDSTT